MSSLLPIAHVVQSNMGRRMGICGNSERTIRPKATAGHDLLNSSSLASTFGKHLKCIDKLCNTAISGTDIPDFVGILAEYSLSDRRGDMVLLSQPYFYNLSYALIADVTVSAF